MLLKNEQRSGWTRIAPDRFVYAIIPRLPIFMNNIPDRKEQLGVLRVCLVENNRTKKKDNEQISLSKHILPAIDQNFKLKKSTI